MSKTIAIAGMGWLGQPLAVYLDTLGYSVKGSVMTLEKATELQQRGFNTFRIVVAESGVHGQIKALFNDVECAIVMIPPGLRRNTGSDFVLKMNNLREEIIRHKVPKVILISNIAVYDDSQGIVTESTLPKPQTSAGQQLWQVEELYTNTSEFQCSVVRFGGLFGGSRQPLRYLVGRKDLSGGNAPINLIHREDCIRIISEIIKQDAFGHVFNAVYPKHPTKSEYYIERAIKHELDPPSFATPDPTEIFKQVDSENLEKILGYQFIKSI